MADKIFIDAGGTSVGRVGSFAAKQALSGNKIFVVNCKNAVISGKRATTIREYKIKIGLGGSSLKGPHYPRDSERIMKRAIRGMLPDYRLGRGREAWKRIRCYADIPAEYKNEKLIKLGTPALAKQISLAELKAGL